MKISLCYRYIGPYGGNISKLFLSETTKPFESNLVGICIGKNIDGIRYAHAELLLLIS
jgi:hypothetical protein